VSALRALGVVCTANGSEDRLPITLDGSNIRGGGVSISAKRSSQFLSGLLYLGALLDEPLTVTVSDQLTARPMVQTTLRVLGTAGVPVEPSADFMSFRVDAPSHFQ